MTERSWDDHKKQVDEWIESIDTPLLNIRNLNSALYSVSELRLWPDYVDSISDEMVIKCWKIVEKLRRREEFPDNLRM